MRKVSKGERTVWRLGTALALLIPLLCIVLAELIGWAPTDVFVASKTIQFGCVLVVAVIMGILGLFWLASYIIVRFF